MHEQYPSRRGVPVDPAELGLPLSHRNLEHQKSFNNHHASFYRRLYGQSVLLSTFRALTINQYALPRDTHIILHRKYSKPAMPTAEQAYAAVMEQYEKQGQLRYGSYIDPVFMPIEPQLVDKIDSEYNQLKVA